MRLVDVTRTEIFRLSRGILKTPMSGMLLKRCLRRSGDLLIKQTFKFQQGFLYTDLHFIHTLHIYLLITHSSIVHYTSIYTLHEGGNSTTAERRGFQISLSLP